MPKQIPAGEMYRRGLPVLGPRLSAAASLVRPGVTVADIGCDHGKLAVYLVKSGISPRVIAGDLNALPLQRARALAAQAGCAEQVECRLGDGLQVLKAGEAPDIVIAGLSGETIVSLLKAAPYSWQRGTQLVLVPVTRAAQLRRWLCGHGFALTKERAVLDAGRAYVAMQAAYTGEQARPGALFLEKGLLRPERDEAARLFLQRRLRYLRDCQSAPLPEHEKQALAALIQEVEACLE